MKWMRFAGLAFVFVAALALLNRETVGLAARAGGVSMASTEAPEPCETACSCNGSCTTVCLDGFGGNTTCGAHGVCQGMCPTCSPNYQPVSSTPIGAWEVNDFGANRCEHWVAYEVLKRDVNQCNPEVWPDRRCCTESLNATAGLNQCCAQFQCGGVTCSQSGLPPC